MAVPLHTAALAGFAGLMLTAALSDLRRLVIPNRLTAALCALWPVHLATTPLAAAPIAALGCAAAVFAAGALLFARGLLGGGDVKLLAAAMLWAAPQHAAALLIGTALLGGALSLLLIMPGAGPLLVALRAGAPAAVEATPANPVPYGVAIAAAALVVTIPPYFG